MPMNAEKVAQLERQLREAKDQALFSKPRGGPFRARTEAARAAEDDRSPASAQGSYPVVDHPFGHPPGFENRAQLLREQGRMYEIIRRKISADEWQRIMDGLEDREERILFGLEPAEGCGKRGAAAQRPGKSGGDKVCPICGKEGLTDRGLKLHMARLHKGEGTGEAEEAA